FLLVFSSIALNIVAQEITDTLGDFKVQDKKIVYQKIFDTDMSFDELTRQIRHSGIIKQPNEQENELIGETEQFDIDYKEAGVKSNAGIYLNFKYSADAIIQYKKGRYRVTLKNIVSHKPGERAAFSSNMESKLDDIIVKFKNHKFRPVFKKRGGHKAFTYT